VKPRGQFSRVADNTDHGSSAGDRARARRDLFRHQRQLHSPARNSSIPLWQDAAGRAPQPGKTWIAVAVLVAVIVSASFGLAPVSIVALSGAVLMILTGVITPRSAVRALDWNVLRENCL